MARKPGDDITVQDLRGIRQLRRVAELLSFVHQSGCGRDQAGNRQLHLDEYVLLILLYLFNPLIDSLRTLQKVAELPTLQKLLGIKRFSLGSFSESCRVFEPALLEQVVEQLAGRLRPVGREQLLRELPGQLTLVDSTVIDTLCTVAEAMFLPLGNERHSHAWRLHLDVDHHVPAAWEITTPKNTGQSDEKNVLRRNLRPDHTYVMDRWYAQFRLWNDIKAAGSSYVCRVRDNSVYRVIEDRPLGAAAVEAGVLRDQLVEMGLGKKPHEQADHPTRLICVPCTPHRKRGKGRKRGGGQSGPTSDGVLRIATDLLEVPAPVIAFLYQYRGRRSLPDRGLLPLPEADPGLPAPAEHPHRGHSGADVCGGDLLHAAEHAQRAQADEVDGDADGAVPAGTGQRAGRAARTEQAGQHGREAAGQRGTVEEDGVLNRG
jgi:hypothetical protein